MTLRTPTWFWLGFALLTACSGVVSTDHDAAVDAGERGDAGSDAGAVGDAGVTDAGPSDAGGDAGFDAGVDAGVTDAGGRVDAGVDAGAPVACPASAVFCEDFESGLDTARWLTNGDATTFTIDTTTPTPNGQRSLHMAYGVPYSHTGLQTVQLKTPVPAPDDRLYVRTYMRFGNLALPGQHPFFIDVADSSGTEVGFGSIINDFSTMAYAPGGLDNARIWYEGGGNQWHPGVEDGDATPTTENGLTAQTWVCVEMMLFGDHQSPQDTQHPNEAVTVWINGVEVPQLAASDALWRFELGRDPPEHWSPRYDRARWRFGLESFGPTHVALDIWFDAIAFSHSRIGCL